MAKSGIYKIVNTATGDTYVGSAVKLSYRWSRHKWALNAGKHHNTHLQRAWQKYGCGAFEFVVVETCDVEDLIPREQHAIDALRPTYNCARSATSRRGTKNSPEHNAAISAKALARWSNPEFKAAASLAIQQAAKTKAPRRGLAHNARVITAFGKSQTLTQWAAETGLKRERVAYRLNRGVPPEEALALEDRRSTHSGRSSNANSI